MIEAPEEPDTGFLQKICHGLVHKQAGHIAAGIIDLDTGAMLAAYHEVTYFTDAYVETVMAATATMFRGPVISRIDELVSAQQDKPFGRHLEEIYFRTPGTHHFLCTVPGTPAALIFVTAISIARDKGWKIATDTLSLIAPHCPEAIHI